jgi:hypothetical protein
VPEKKEVPDQNLVNIYLENIARLRGCIEVPECLTAYIYIPRVRYFPDLGYIFSPAGQVGTSTHHCSGFPPEGPHA